MEGWTLWLGEGLGADNGRDVMVQNRALISARFAAMQKPTHSPAAAECKAFTGTQVASPFRAEARRYARNRVASGNAGSETAHQFAGTLPENDQSDAVLILSSSVPQPGARGRTLSTTGFL
jgi:hypothetical protein